jgi:hypothetical protein
MSADEMLLDRIREIPVPQFSDRRGALFALERLRPLPFTPVRTFIITDVPAGEHRAQHALLCDEFLWMLSGGCRALVRTEAGGAGADERRFQLQSRGPGLYLPEGVWLDLSNFLPGSMLVCLAAEEYSAGRRQ